MAKKIGFIGTGNMGSALARAARRVIPGECILLANRTAEKSMSLAKELGAEAVSNLDIAMSADYVVLGVKPQMMADLMAQLAPALLLRQEPYVLVSMAAGISIERLKKMTTADTPVIRIMPNTPCAIGEGIVLYTCSPEVQPGELAAFLAVLSGGGRCVELEEARFDAGGAISGCGPAFAALFIEALADGGVACGLPRTSAEELAAQMLSGTAKLMLESGSHPGALKDAVCSPGGTTIQGVRTLENAGFRGAVMEAVIAAWEKNRAL